MRYIIQIFAGVFILLCTSAAVYGQATVKDSTAIPRCYWIGWGWGASSLGAYTAMINFNAEIKNQWVVAANFQTETNTKLFNGAAGHEIDVNITNFLLGKIYKDRGMFLNVLAGVGLVSVYTRDSNGGIFGSIDNKKTRNTVGIPLTVQGYFVGFKTIGFGISGYANLNTIKSTAGFSLNFALGRMPTYKK